MGIVSSFLSISLSSLIPNFSLLRKCECQEFLEGCLAARASGNTVVKALAIFKFFTSAFPHSWQIPSEVHSLLNLAGDDPRGYTSWHQQVALDPEDKKSHGSHHRDTGEEI